jgi:hypothetical protein
MYLACIPVQDAVIVPCSGRKTPACLNIYRLLDDTSSTNVSVRLVLVASYGLPVFTKRVFGVTMNINHNTSDLSHRPIDQQTLLISISVIGTPNWSGVMFVNTTDLLRQAQARSETPFHVVPWDAWGPPRTRLIPDRTSSYSNSCANRAIYFNRTQERPHRLQLLDFNPFTLSPTIPPSRNTTIRHVERISVVKGGSVFRSNVLTSLPYREITVEFDGFFSDRTMLHMSTEMIVGVSILQTISVPFSDSSLPFH